MRKKKKRKRGDENQGIDFIVYHVVGEWVSECVAPVVSSHGEEGSGRRRDQDGVCERGAAGRVPQKREHTGGSFGCVSTHGRKFQQGRMAVSREPHRLSVPRLSI